MNIYEPCDIRHDLNIIPYPFDDDVFSEVDCIAVLEHLDCPVAVMREIHRIAKDGARIHIEVPYHKRQMLMTVPPHKHDMKPDWFRAWDNTTVWGSHFDERQWNPPQFRIIKIRKVGMMVRVFRRIPMLVKWFTTRTVVEMRVVKTEEKDYRIR